MNSSPVSLDVGSRLFGRLAVCSLLAVAATHVVAAEPSLSLESPLRVLASQTDDALTRVSLDAVGYQQLKSQTDVRLVKFSLSGERTVDLELHRIDVFTPNAQIVLGTANGDVPLPQPDVLLLGGTVAGHPDSSVFLSLSPHGTRGWVQFAGERFVISSGPGKDKSTAVVFDYNALAANNIKWMNNWTCGVDNLVNPPGGVAPVPNGPRGSPSAAAAGGVVVFHAQIAVETDFEFTNNLFGGNLDASAAYAATLIGASSGIYTRDVGTQFSISYLRLWEANNDPWTSTSTSSQLTQFRNHWNAQMGNIFRHTTHFLSGRSLGGGIAYLNTVCLSGWNYAVSANLSGFFPLPVQDHHGSNWDIMVVSHELGHNFGSPHTHAMVPPIDRCAFGECSEASSGTIMSYCHLCAGGMANMLMEFHQRIIFEELLPFLTFEVGCDLAIGPATVFSQPQGVITCVGGSTQMTIGAGGSAPISFQWRKDGIDLSGATSPILTIDPISESNVGTYDVVVTNDEGIATSDPAVVAAIECTAPAVGVSGCRAVTIAPDELPLTAPVAFHVSSPDYPCLSAYVDADGILTDEPVFLPANDWSEIVVVGEGIVPNANYDVRMDFGSVGDPRLTDKASVLTEIWGDVAGNNIGGVWADPNGEVTILDVTAGIACFTGEPGAPPLERCDVYPAIPDGGVEIIDILHMVGAFQGLPYPFDGPPLCP